MADGGVTLRRTWPQRVVVLAGVGLVVAALTGAWGVQTLYDGLAEVDRVAIPAEVLQTDTVPGEPVNFLLVGTDSAEGIDPADEIHIGREVDPRGRHNADSISILRLDPRSGQAWVMSIPRDLYVDIPGASTGRINSTLLIEGPETLIATVRETFGIEINHYVVLDFYGFREVVDELGGVPVWFEYPSRSRDQTGLQIVEPGCHVLDGVDALRYVRTRDYEQFIDGSWVQVGNSDFGRIERQQDFLVLTLDRAIQRGARNPRTLASLVEAGAQSVELDQALTVAELADLGGFFADFDPENLARFTPEVTTEYDGSRYLGEVLKPDVNEEIYAVFRGQAGGLAPSDVELDVVVSDATHLDEGADVDLLGTLGFLVHDAAALQTAAPTSVVLYPPGERPAAVQVARHLIPIPALVEDPDVEGVTLVLGDDHEQVAFFAPHAYDMAIAEIEERGQVPVPDLATAAVPGASSTSDGDAPASTPPTTTVGVDDRSDAATPTDTSGIIGRPPEGVTCT